MKKEFKSLSEYLLLMRLNNQPIRAVPERKIKEKIQNVQRRLKEEMCRCKTMVGEGKKCYACRNINKIFLEEIGEKLLKEPEKK